MCYRDKSLKIKLKGNLPMMARLTILEGPLGRFLNVYFLKSIMALYNFFF